MTAVVAPSGPRPSLRRQVIARPPRILFRIINATLTISVSNFLLEYPRLLVIIWPTPTDVLVRMFMVIESCDLLSALIIATSVELYYRRGYSTDGVVKRVAFGLTIIALPSLSVLVLSDVAPSFFSVLYEMGMTASKEDFILYNIWEVLIISVISVAYRVRRGQAHEQDTRAKRVAREWQEARRTVIETRMQALQARVEPQLLFDALGALPHLYSSTRAEGELLIGTLTEFLRISLPHVATETTIAQDIEQIRAYAELLNTAGLARPKLTSEIDEDAAASRNLASGLLYSLTAHWMRSAQTGDTFFNINAWRVGTRVHILVTGPLHDIERAVERVTSDLKAVYESSCHVSTTINSERLTCHVEYDDAFVPAPAEIL